MPTRTAVKSTTTKKRTAKTSRYFTRAAKLNDNNNQENNVSAERVRRAKEGLKTADTLSTTEIGSLSSPSLDSAGSVSCRDGLSSATEVSTSGQDERENALDGLEKEAVIDNSISAAMRDDFDGDGGDGDGDGIPIITTTTTQASPEEQQLQKQPRKQSPRKRPPKLSPYFHQTLLSFPIKKPVPSSCLPFPPLSAPTFGLIQEQLSSTPFRLLIATIFLNRTRGPVAIPVLFKLFHRYPTINDMASAKHEDIVSIIRGLGFQNQRATKFIALAQKWRECPPERGRRYRKLNYPCKRDGRDVGVDEVVGDEDDTISTITSDGSGEDNEQQPGLNSKVAWEIAHLPGVGAYAIDSWRIFCRDQLRHDPNKSSSEKEDYEPEWKRVLPQDKELRAYLTWLWLKEGWTWNCETGERTKADSEMMMRAEKEGGVVFEDGRLVLNHSSSAMTVRDDAGWVRKAGFSLDCT